MIGELPVISKDVIRQRHLEHILRRIFPDDYISANVRSEGELRYPVTGQFLELDIWIPNKHLCFEFQDSYHYIATTYSHKPLENVQAKDTFKQEGVRYKGGTLLQVPCWWNGRIDSLTAEVAFCRPDIILNEVNPDSHIPLNPPPDFFTLEGIPNVGELMLASFPTDPKFTSYISPSSPWWLGEKYDGIRFCWNGAVGRVYARSGAELVLSRSFYRHLSKGVFLDGEIWFGRGGYSESQKIFLKADVEEIDWPFLRVVVFDDPSLPVRLMPFEKRYKRLLGGTKSDHPFVVNAPRMLHDNNKKRTITQITQYILEDGGEGVIMRRPRSLYESGRSSNLLKLKATRADKEALVVSVDGDSYKLQLPDGDTFLLHDQMSDGPRPKKGDVVTFEFDYGTRSVTPANPKINRIRKDLSWEEVQRDYERESQLNDYSRRMVGTTQYTTPAGFWTSEKGKNMRTAFEKFAKSMGFDPLIADHWYRVPRQSLLRLPVAATVYRKYNGSAIRALLDVFPDIGLDQTKFTIVPHHYWKNVDNRRNFFMEVARSKGFDALVAQSWYSKANRTALLTERRVASVLESYGNNFADALVHLFPEIGIDPIKFASLPHHHWESDLNRRNLFSNFAVEKGMDPLLPDTWYSLMRDIALDIKDSSVAIHHYHGGDVIKALLSLFPHIGLDPQLLLHLQDAHWKKFIRDFIDEKNFDPLVPDNWYQVTREKIIEVGEGSQKIIHHNRNQFVLSVMNAFPTIGLDLTKFSLLNNEYTRDGVSRRRFFERFARKRGFNHKTPDNWYPIPRAEFMKEKGAYMILTHYGGSFVKGLMQVFPDIGLQPHRFATMAKNFWQSAENRREFLATTARTQFGVDPLSAEHWYHLERGQFAAVKGVGSLLAYHQGDLIRALQDLFPDLSLETSKFYHVPNKFWYDAANRRKFFDDFAEDNKFDPLVPSNWYHVSKDSFLATKGSAKVLQFHERSLVKALLSLFPDIGLSPQAFPSTAHHSKPLPRPPPSPPPPLSQQ